VGGGLGFFWGGGVSPSSRRSTGYVGASPLLLCWEYCGRVFSASLLLHHSTSSCSFFCFTRWLITLLVVDSVQYSHVHIYCYYFFLFFLTSFMLLDQRIHQWNQFKDAFLGWLVLRLSRMTGVLLPVRCLAIFCWVMAGWFHGRAIAVARW